MSITEKKGFNLNPFEAIGKKWMLISAKDGDKVNTMTASWGGMGVIWGEDVVYIFVRQSRYTKEFIDNSAYFSLSFFDDEYRKKLAYLGRVSRRDENKIEKAGLSVVYKEDIPYFEEASTVVLCEKLSRHYISPEGFIKKDIIEKWYGDNDYHDMYIGRIVDIIQK